jgi:hypothetical protein
MTLCICQSSSSLLANSMAKWVLRERVYYAALEQFTVASRTPTQTFAELREDIRAVLEFWNKMIAEKKYLKDEHLDFGSGMLANGATNASSGTPDTNSLVGVDVTSSNGAAVSPSIAHLIDHNSTI